MYLPCITNGKLGFIVATDSDSTINVAGHSTRSFSRWYVELTLLKAAFPHVDVNT